MHDVTKTVKDSKRGAAEQTAPPPFTCSHGNCPSQTHHVGQIVAEEQGLRFPEDVGSPSRWLREAKPLCKYADSEIIDFVRHKVRRDRPKWDDQPLRPQYVAEDIGAYLRKKTNGRAAMLPTEAELQAYSDRQKGVGA